MDYLEANLEESFHGNHSVSVQIQLLFKRFVFPMAHRKHDPGSGMGNMEQGNSR